MPMYYDLTKTKRQRTLCWPHIELATIFFEDGIRRNDYFKRGAVPDRNELAGEDLTEEIIYAWAQVRGWLAKSVAHLHFQHKDGLAKDHDHAEGAARLSRSKNGEKFEVMGHGHAVPPLFALAEVIKNDTPNEAAVRRAARDLEGLIGMRTAAARGKFDPKEVFDAEES